MISYDDIAEELRQVNEARDTHVQATLMYAAEMFDSQSTEESKHMSEELFEQTLAVYVVGKARLEAMKIKWAAQQREGS